MATANSTDPVTDILQDKPKQRLFVIEFYVCITAALLAYLVLFGSLRRSSHNNLFKLTLWLGYTQSMNLVANTMGRMQTATFDNELFVIWAVVLVIVLGSADSITAFNLSDNEQRKRYNFTMVVQMYWLAWLIMKYAERTKLFLLIIFFYVVIVLKLKERSRGFKLASRTALARNTKLVADFMGYEHELGGANQEIDPVHMKGYNYIVRGEDEKLVKVTPPLYHQKLDMEKVVTVQKVWQCEGRLLSSAGDPNNKFKDICLSFALFKLLCRRFSGYHFSECSQDKTWNFVRYGLFSEENDFERPFRVIEMELTFLFDLFFTKYAAIFAPGKFRYKVIELVLLGLGILSGIFGLLKYPPAQGSVKIQNNGIDYDAIVTMVVIIELLLLEIVQFFFVVSSNWSKVILLSRYVQKSSWHNKFMEMVIKVICLGHVFKPWDGSLGQYSLLKCFNNKPSILIYNGITTLFLDRPRVGQRGSSHVKVPIEVKKAIIVSLKVNGKRLSNGIASLHRNDVDGELSWACRLETTTHIIMVWHIATSLCEYALAEAVAPTQMEHFIVATRLSKYCAHLVACKPRFLPDHAYVSDFIFDQIVIETREFLKECKTLKKRYEKVMKFGEGELGDHTVLKRGALLGKCLVPLVQKEELGWKILADFWAEMILFVAPSDDAMFHAETLALGGEFITHLWTLLSHAGILKQDLVMQEI